MILEAEKSYHLLSARWRHRKASGVFQSKSESLGTGVSMCQSPSKGRKRPKSQLKQSGREREFNLPPPFVLFRSSVSWVMPTHPGEGDLL